MSVARDRYRHPLQLVSLGIQSFLVVRRSFLGGILDIDPANIGLLMLCRAVAIGECCSR